MKINRVLLIRSVLITVVSLLLPFRVLENEMQLGYPLSFLTIFKSTFAFVNTGWHPTILKLISINLFTFCVDVAAIYILMVVLVKIRKKQIQ
ncbi:MAG: hypothetical protein K0R19_167 [Bacillota bacterium]|jgi:hypothetical protein|nr:hypothetical protein [Bacillota bacterium]